MGKAKKAGIDPINKLIDRNLRDNVKTLSEKEVSSISNKLFGEGLRQKAKKTSKPICILLYIIQKKMFLKQ